MERLFLNASTPLVLAVADWLAEQSRLLPGGVRALDHLLVVVPTRQAGRRLRLALAERTGGCLPPLIRLPAQLIAPDRPPEPPVATPAETLGLLSRLLLDLELADFPHLFPAQGRPREKTFPWALGVARQLSDLWALLQENALTFADAAERAGELLAGEDLDIEVSRWRDLARLEALFFEHLLRHRRTPAPLARKRAVDAPLPPPEGVERIVLPALADAQPALYPVLERLGARLALTVLIHADPADGDRFDRWGRPEPAQWLGDRAPVLPLSDGQIHLAANSAEQARLAARLFAAVPPGEEPPALGLADDALFGELQSAFLALGIPLHNPAAYPLAASSLGRLIRQLELLRRDPGFPLLAAFLREADVMHWLQSRLADAPGYAHADALAALDELQNEALPLTLDAARAGCAQALEAGSGRNEKGRLLLRVLDAVRELLDPRGRPHIDHLTAMLQSLFSARTLEENQPGDRELAAAAEAALALFEALSSDALAGALGDEQRSLLYESLLGSATFQLEPERADALLTEGWLELPWSPAPELVVTGFNEGSVPDAVVGHAFLPDRLRQGLGLTSNERRAARDTYLLRALLAARQPGAVRLLLERASSRHDVRKPSRLLFLCDEPDLARRAKRLFRDAESAAAGHPRSLPDAWRLALPPPPPPPERLSATALKAYLACPFTFFLRHTLGMEACGDRMAELDAAAFGTLCHEALEAFSHSPSRDSDDEAAIGAALQAEVWRLVRRRFGDPLPAVLHLQAASACSRLGFFARCQAGLRRDGWRIAATEQPLALSGLGIELRGRADRIDRHEVTGAWRILDYKTWDRIGKGDGADRFSSAAKADLASAAARGLPAFTLAGKTRVWTDLQLPLYRLMAQASGAVPPGAAVECGYIVLGESEAETACRVWDFSGCLDEALATARWAAGRIRRGLFWPPSPREEWARDFASLFLESPEHDVAPAWIDDQLARLEQGGAACAP